MFSIVLTVKNFKEKFLLHYHGDLGTQYSSPMFVIWECNSCGYKIVTKGENFIDLSQEQERLKKLGWLA